MRKNFFVVACGIALLVTASGCASRMGEGSDSVQIRIANQSGQDFENVEVTFPSGKVEYGGVKDGAVTPYRQVKSAYRYALVEVSTKGRTITFQPQDFVGEELLGPGRYTYALRLDESRENLRLELVTD